MTSSGLLKQTETSFSSVTDKEAYSCFKDTKSSNSHLWVDILSHDSVSSHANTESELWFPELAQIWLHSTCSRSCCYNCFHVSQLWCGTAALMMLVSERWRFFRWEQQGPAGWGHLKEASSQLSPDDTALESSLRALYESGFPFPHMGLFPWQSCWASLRLEPQPPRAN